MMPRWWGAIVLVGVAALVASPAGGQEISQAPQTPAQAPSQPVTTMLTLMVSEVDTSTVNVLARLTGPGGRILGNQQIAFELVEPFFGNRPARLGTATTISTGVATYMYRPSYEGEHRLRATFAGSPTLAPAAAEIKYTAAVPRSVSERTAGHSIELVWRITGALAGTVTAAVWVGLAGLMIWVWVGLKRPDRVSPARPAGGAESRAHREEG